MAPSTVPPNALTIAHHVIVEPFIELVVVSVRHVDRFRYVPTYRLDSICQLIRVTVPTQNGWKAIALSAGARQELFISTDWNRETLEAALRRSGAEV